MDDRHRESAPDGNAVDPSEKPILTAFTKDDFASTSSPEEGQPSEAQSGEVESAGVQVESAGVQVEPAAVQVEPAAVQVDPAGVEAKSTDDLPESSLESSGEEESIEDDGIETSELQAILDHHEALRQVVELQTQHERSRREAQEYRELALRKAADLENFKRRTQKQIEENNRYGAERVLKEFLPVVDDLDRAIQHAKASIEATSSDAGVENPSLSFIEGIVLVLRKLQQTLERFGVVGFDSLKQPFNPQVHEALSQVDDPDHPTGTVVAEYLKGYRMYDRLIRPALVIVSRAPTPVEPLPAVEDTPPPSDGQPASSFQHAVEEPAPEVSASSPILEADREGE